MKARYDNGYDFPLHTYMESRRLDDSVGLLFYVEIPVFERLALAIIDTHLVFGSRICLPHDLSSDGFKMDSAAYVREE